MRPTEHMWNLLMEAAYSRAHQDLEHQKTNKDGEVVTLEEKINYWRQHIPEAAGVDCINFLAAQRRLQAGVSWETSVLQVHGGELQGGDLISRRNQDLEEWMIDHAGLSPTRAPEHE